MLKHVIAVIGPPAAGKTTLTMQFGRQPGQDVFRLREHVPETILAATATSAERLGWIDDVTVAVALRHYVESVIDQDRTHTVLFDNFPGSARQVGILLSTVQKLVPKCGVHPVELVAAETTLNRRIRQRRVCHRCEHDPIHDPRLPATPNPADPRRCGRCNNILHPRRGDAPRLLAARMQRYRRAAEGIRAAFADAGITVVRLESNGPPEQIADELIALLNARSTLS
jgi:adenylate kinase